MELLYIYLSYLSRRMEVTKAIGYDEKDNIELRRTENCSNETFVKHRMRNVGK
jgi:hypothetical protein